MSKITFHRAYPSTPLPMQADASALGSMPTAAFQYCEPMRAASSLGYYIFSPFDLLLKFNGAKVHYKLTNDKADWEPLVTTTLGFDQAWDNIAPPALQGMAPNFLTQIFVPGIVQVWSGLFVSTDPHCLTLVRPAVNFPTDGSFTCFEGLIDTGAFNPAPLFINIRLHETDLPIRLNQVVPLFQVQVVDRRSTYEDVDYCSLAAPDEGVWDGITKTLRRADEVRPAGQYGAAVRRRHKQGAQS